VSFYFRSIQGGGETVRKEQDAKIINQTEKGKIV
jgi:hypothetical protein